MRRLTIPRMPIPEIGAVRRADQSGHVPGDACDHEADDEDERHRHRRECDRVTAKGRRFDEAVNEPARYRHAHCRQADDPAWREIAIELVAGGPFARDDAIVLIRPAGH